MTGVRSVHGVWLIVAGVVTFLVSQVFVFVIRRNAYYNCSARPGPERAYPHEGGPAGFDIQQIPVAGVNCWWNSMDGGIITTFHPDVTLSAVTYAAILLVLAGIVVVRLTGVRAGSARSRTSE